ncbi:MAG: DUF6179 domain-containing protein [Lachnospiraceae bacterium]|nr:DUF6179 domain-containing protein [Lachnospiraceae bacterium]
MNEDSLNQLMILLDKRIFKYTSGESSSVMVETAQSIMESVNFCIDAYYNEYGMENAISENLSIEELFLKGKEIVKQRHAICRKLFVFLRKERMNYENLAYQQVIEMAIPLFLRNYDIEFGAHIIGGIIDYPLAVGISDLKGIDFYLEYVQKLRMENRFCRRFKTEEINELLRRMGNIYVEMLVNIFQLVLQNIIGRGILKKDFLSIKIDETGLKELYCILNGLEENEIRQMVKGAVFNIIDDMGIKEVQLQRYIEKVADDNCCELKNCVDNNALNNFFIV